MNRDGMGGSARTDVADPGRSPWRMIAGTLAIVGGCTLVAMAMRGHFELTNLTMVYLLGVVVAAVAFGRRAAIAAAVLSVATFDFLLVHPRFSFAVEDAQYLVTFAVMLVVAVVIGTLTAWVREQRRAAELRERRTAALYRLSHDLLVRSTAAEVLQAAVERIGALVGAEAAILLPDTQGRLRHAAGSEALAAEPRELAAAQWAHDNGQPAGQGAAAHPEAAAHHLPLLAPLRTLGVLAVRPRSAGTRAAPDARA